MRAAPLPSSDETAQVAVRQRGATTFDALLDRRSRLVAAALWLALLVVYHLDDSLVEEGDAVANVELPLALLATGSLAFTPDDSPILFFWKSSAPLSQRDDFYVRSWFERHHGKAAGIWHATGHLQFNGPRYFVTRSPKNESLFVSTFSVVPGLTFLPFAAALRAIDPNFVYGAPLRLSFAKLYAASLVAASAVFLFWIARRFTRPSNALLLAIAYALGTCVWSIASETLWQQTVNLALLVGGAHVFLVALERNVASRWMMLAGLLFGVATASRPTAVFYLAALAFYLWRERRAALPLLAGGAAIPLVAVALYNVHYFGTPFNFAQELIGHQIAVEKTGSQNVWQTPLIIGAAGLLVSPSRGLLVFSPFLALAFFGIRRLWQDARYKPLRPIVLAALLTMAVQAKWFDWWGGWTFGYRPWLEAVPALVLCMLPLMEQVRARHWSFALFGLALGWSVFVQSLGAFAYDKYWNARDLQVVVTSRGEQRFFLTEAEARNAAALGLGTYQGEFSCNIDKPQCRGRLWSLEDNIISFYLERWPVSREHRVSSAWRELAASR